MKDWMSENESERKYAYAALVVQVIAGWIVVVLCLGWCYRLHNSLEKTEVRLATASAEYDARLRAATEALSQAVGMTQHQLEERSAELMEQQKASASRLEQTQIAAKRQIGQVSNEVSNVRDDVAATRSALEIAKLQLQRTMGDTGVMSGLIARNHEELEALKRKGDRNYYEFLLHKGSKAQLGTVQVQLKKINDKHARYTMLVKAGDRTIEKKDKSLMEPVQFYSGGDRALYEMVVFQMKDDQVAGYLAVPKISAGR